MADQESLFDIMQEWFRSDGEDVLSVMDEEDEDEESVMDGYDEEEAESLRERADGIDPDLAYDRMREERLFGV